MQKQQEGKKHVAKRDSLELSDRAKEVVAKATQATKTEKAKGLSAEEGLSDKAKTYLKNLRRSRGHVDFRISERERK